MDHVVVDSYIVEIRRPEDDTPLSSEEVNEAIYEVADIAWTVTVVPGSKGRKES